MGDYNNRGFGGGGGRGYGGGGGGRGFGRPRFGGGGGYGNDRPRYDRGGGGFDGMSAQFSATCSKCGQDCKLPFKPNGFKPVLCNNCFKQAREERGGDNYGSTREFESREPKQFESKPTNDKSSETQHYTNSKRFGDIFNQLTDVNAKLDLLLQAAGLAYTSTTAKKQEAKKATTPKATTEAVEPVQEPVTNESEPKAEDFV